MAAPERFAEMPDFSLAPQAPSIHGTSRPFAALQHFVRYWGVERTTADFSRDDLSAFDQSGHRAD
jgi:hypothetical protein